MQYTMSSCARGAPRSLRVALVGHHAPAVKKLRADVRCTAVTAPTNPAIQYGNFRGAMREAPSSEVGYMTLNGAIGKTAILLLITAAGAAYTWKMFFDGVYALQAGQMSVMALTNTLQRTSMSTGIAAFCVSLLTSFKPNWADKTGPLYAALKGGFLGAFSAMLEMRYPGLVMNAVMLTMSIAGALLLAFKANMIEVNNQFRNIVTLSMGGVFLSYLAVAALRMFGVNMAFMYTGTTGLLITGVVAVIAAASLLTDYANLQQMERNNFPRWAEWYGGFSVLVSLVWLYFQLARMLMILRGGSQRD